VGADGLVRHVASAAFYAVIDANLADGAERFVVESGDTESGAQFFIELAEICELRGKSRDFSAVIGQQELLVSRVPKAGELPFEHDAGENGHLEAAVGILAEFGATVEFLDTDNPARAAHGKPQAGQSVHLGLFEAFSDVPHSHFSVNNPGNPVKVTMGRGILWKTLQAPGFHWVSQNFCLVL